jgi:hypothetical protein
MSFGVTNSTCITSGGGHGLLWGRPDEEQNDGQDADVAEGGNNKPVATEALGCDHQRSCLNCPRSPS